MIIFQHQKSDSYTGFGDSITRERLELPRKFLHFSDNESQTTYQGPPKLFKIFPIIFHLNNKFQTLYLPYQNISVDESLALWKSRLSFKQFLPLKYSKFGIKSFELCDSQTGYLWSVLIYTGKETRIESPLITGDMNKTTAIVMKLIEPLLKQGRTVSLQTGLFN
jgi:hypothetical protein